MIVEITSSIQEMQQGMENIDMGLFMDHVSRMALERTLILIFNFFMWIVIAYQELCLLI